MKSKFYLAVLVAVGFAFCSEKSFSQCSTTVGGTICDSTKTFTSRGILNAHFSWQSKVIPQTGRNYVSIMDSVSNSNSKDMLVMEIYTCGTNDLQLNISPGYAMSVVKYNLNNENCGGSANNERVIIYGKASGMTVNMMKNDCGGTTDTVTLWYRKLAAYPSNADGFGNQDAGAGEWIGEVYKWNNANYYFNNLGTTGNRPINFTLDTGTVVPVINGCSVCPSATTTDSFSVRFKMDSLVPRGFYKITCNTSNDLKVSCGSGGQASILDYWSNGSSSSSKTVTQLFIPTGTNNYNPYTGACLHNGNWTYELKKATGNFKADITICKLDGDYSWGNNVWNAYVFDGNGTSFNNYIGQFGTSTPYIGYNWTNGQPSVNNTACSQSMDDSLYKVHFLMKYNFAAGNYKFRIRSYKGGQTILTDRKGVVTAYLVNNDHTHNYDVTSAYNYLSGDTFLMIKVYEQGGTKSISYNHCRQPKDVGHITTSGGTVTGDSVCNGNTITLTADTTDGTETQWWKGATCGTGTLIGTGASINVTPDSSTTFYVRNRNYCVNTNDTLNKIDLFSNSCTSRRVTLVSKPGNPTAPAAQSVCSDTAYTFTFDSVLAGSGGNQIIWSLYSGFDTSYTISSGGSFNVAVGSSGSSKIYLRSRVSSTGCVSVGKDSTSATVYARPEPPTPPAPQSVASDTPYTFVFENVQVGFGGNEIEWSLDSVFGSSEILTPCPSPEGEGCSFALTVPVDSSRMIWVRSKDSITGCVSDARATIGIALNIYQRQPINVDSVVMVCTGTSTGIKVDSSNNNKFYVLLTDTGIVSSSYGNDSTLILSTANIYTPEFYKVMRIDTAVHDTALSSGVLINPINSVDSNVFIEGDTLVYINDSALYHGSAMNGIKAIYSLTRGSATVDSITGWVYNMSGTSFTLKATLSGPTGCGSAFDTLRVHITDIAAPVAPAPVTAYIDSPTQVVTIVFNNVYVGSGGDQIEWATNDSFANSTITASPANISVMLNGIGDTTIWLRSKDSRSGSFSQTRSTSARSALPYLSAGLLDKSKWVLDVNNSDEFDYNLDQASGNYMLYTDNAFIPASFFNKWNLVYAWQGSDLTATPRIADYNESSSYTLVGDIDHPSKQVCLYDYGQNSIGSWGNDNQCTRTGCGHEIGFTGDGICHLIARKLPSPVSHTWATGYSRTYTYQAGMIGSAFSFPLVNGLWEIRCKLPDESFSGASPAFWNYTAKGDFTIYDGKGSYAGANVSPSNAIGDDFIDTNNDGEEESQGNCGASTIRQTNCNYTEGWHTFSAVSTGTEIVFFIDGKETWSTTFSNVTTPTPISLSDSRLIAHRWPDDIYTGSTARSPMYLNNQVFDNSPDEPVPTWDSCEFLIDYFRYYTPVNNIDANNPGAQIFQNLSQNGVAKTLESPSNSIIPPANVNSANNNILPIANNNSQSGLTHDIEFSKIAYTNEAGLQKVYYRGKGNDSRCYNAYFENGVWKEYPLVDGLYDVKGNITVDGDRVYYLSTNEEIKFFQWVGNQWLPFSTYVKPRTYSNAGHYFQNDFSVDKLGRVFYIAQNGDIHAWCPTSFTQGTDVPVISNSNAKWGLTLHSCGCLLFYNDQSDAMHQWSWWGNWQDKLSTLAGHFPSSAVMDEDNSILYYAGQDDDIHRYFWDYNSINASGDEKLGNTCTGYDNAVNLPAWEQFPKTIALSSDKSKIYYLGNDDKIWYYYNDKDHGTVLNKIIQPNWFRTPLNFYETTTGTMAFEPWENGRLFYVGLDKKLHYTDWVDADNPITCPYVNPYLQVLPPAAFYKTDSTNASVPIANEKIETDTLLGLEVRVIPNPSNGKFKFQIFSDFITEVDVKIYDINGKEIGAIRKRIYSKDDYEIIWDASVLNNGVYYYIIRVSDGNTVNGKLIKI